jgi:Leucine-rich repeat (LRR) protein
MRLRRIFDVSPFLIQLQPLNTPEFRALSSLFGISLPSPNPSSSDVSTACESLFANVPYILEGVKTSRVLSDKEQKPFRTMSTEEIIQDPSLLYTLLHTAHEISLVAPFLNGLNHGPGLSRSMTLEAKAEAVRKRLKEKGDSYTELQCVNTGMLCFPTEFRSLQNLQKLNLYHNRLTSIPDEIGQLAKLRELGLSDNRLTTIPAQVGQLAQLQFLDLSDNRLTTLPTEIGRLVQLQRLELRNNRLTTIPAEVGQLTQLRRLGLSDNRLTSIPDGIWHCTQDINIYLADNPLTVTPKSTQNVHIFI